MVATTESPVKVVQKGVHEKLAKDITEARSSTNVTTKEQQLKDELKRALISQQTHANEIVTENYHEFEVLPFDEKNDALSVAKAVEQNLDAVRGKFLKAPASASPEKKAAYLVMIKLANKQLQDITQASYLHTIVTNSLYKDGYMTFSSPGGIKTEFERDFETLCKQDETSARLLGESLVEAAQEGSLPGLSEADAREKFITHIKQPKTLTFGQKEKERLTKASENYENWEANFDRYINSIGPTLTQKIKEKYELEVVKRQRDYGISSTKAREGFDKKVEIEVEALKGKLEMLKQVKYQLSEKNPRQPDMPTRTEMMSQYKAILGELMNNYLIDPSTYSELIRQADELVPIMKELKDLNLI